MRYLTLSFVLFVFGQTQPALTHEFWIAPENYQVELDQPIIADLINGQEFNGGVLAWYDNRMARAEVQAGGTTTQLTGRLGDLPAINTVATVPGLHVIAVETAPSALTYREAEKFANFVEHKKLPVDPNSQDYPFREVYTRHAKALINVGQDSGSDMAMGLVTEFVALENPYQDDMSDGFDVQILYLGAPRADAQIEVFQMDPKGAITISLLMSDKDGRATVPVRPGHRYLLDSVVLRKPDPASIADIGGPRDVAWETLWAAMTFEVPAD
ncbi:MAG: DUF4198 domain-containing protein [Cognatishimia sp.]|uniref:DUF4198 domain-containing protein n=1 Tax=Cognatishimia sp. TaxID=2211648 RepID=UPI004059DF91